MRIDYSKKFIKALKKSPLSIRKKFIKRIEIFELDEYSKILNNHPLKGKWRGYRSINITGDWRAIYKKIDNNLARFHLVGTHSQLYG